MDLVPHKKQSLTRAQFEQLADVPPELARDIYLRAARTDQCDLLDVIR